MFSYFKGGVTDTIQTSTISIDTLKNVIADNPDKNKIQRLRALEYGSKEYKALKCQLPTVTPHGIFNTRKVDGFNQFSGYLYFDIDSAAITIPITEYKARLIEEYGYLVSLLGVSVGGSGIFFYVHISYEAEVIPGNFDVIYQYVKEQVFGRLPIDNKAGGLARAHFIPYDEDVYINDNSILEITKSIIEKNNNKEKKDISKYISNTSNSYRCTYTFSNITEVLVSLKFQTQVTVQGPIYDIKPVEFVKLYIPAKIPDGKKHRTYYAMANTLIHLNPTASLHTIQSFIFWVNQNYTGGKPMNRRELMNTVADAYKRTKETGTLLVKPKIKSVHFNPNCGLSGKEKRHEAAKINGQLKKQKSIQQIQAAITKLGSGMKLTRAIIAKLSGLSICTVKKYWKQANKSLAE